MAPALYSMIGMIATGFVGQQYCAIGAIAGILGGAFLTAHAVAGKKEQLM